MKKWMIVSLFVMAIVMVSSVSYAWFTYVQRKSLVQLTSHDIQVSLMLGQDIIGSSLVIDGLSYVDFEEEVMNNEVSDGFNEVGLNYTIYLNVSSLSPLVKVWMSFTHEHPELIILLIDEGIVESGHVSVSDYHSYLRSIGSQAVSKEAFLDSIEAHNQIVLDHLKQMVLKPGTQYQMQMIIWADYQRLAPGDDYKLKTYTLDLSYFMISGKGDFDA